MANEKLQALAADTEFNAKLENAATEQEAEAVLKEYGVYNQVMESAELSEAQLSEVAGGSKTCDFLNNCKYKCNKCGKTWATLLSAKTHFLLTLHTFTQIKK